MKSPLGRNAVTRSLLYDVSPGRFLMSQFSKGYFQERWVSDLLPDVTVRARFLLELLFIRDGLLYQPQSFFTRDHLKTLINSVIQTHFEY